MAEIRDSVTHEIIGAGIEVHRNLGPGMLESVCEECLCYALTQRGVAFQRQPGLPVIYKGIQLEIGFRPDLIVENLVIVELKCVEKFTSVHDAQVLTYLRLAGKKTGLLMNFQSQPLIDVIRRLVL
jgi:GxxExxY protein